MINRINKYKQNINFPNYNYNFKNQFALIFIDQNIQLIEFYVHICIFSILYKSYIDN